MCQKLARLITWALFVHPPLLFLHDISKSVFNLLGWLTMGHCKKKAVYFHQLLMLVSKYHE